MCLQKTSPCNSNVGLLVCQSNSSGGYWAESSWGNYSYITLQPSQRITGNTSYYLDGYGNLFVSGDSSFVGWDRFISGWTSGTVYQSNGGILTRYTISGTSTITVSSKTSYYVGGSTYYTLGGFYENIEEDIGSSTPINEINNYGLVYVTTLNSGGYDYLVYQGQNGYYGYRKV